MVLTQKKRPKPITIEIMGGIGNQLFAFIAGTYLSSALGTSLRVFQRGKRPGESVHTSSIESLAIGTVIERHTPPVERLSLLLRRQMRLFALRLGASEKRASELSRIHVSSAIGADPLLLSCQEGYYVSGYFQSHEYFKFLKENDALPPLSLLKPSQWFNVQLERINAEQPIAIHVRRGDYLSSENEFIGALSPKYYLQAIALARQSISNGSQTKVWIFTDDPKMVEQELGAHLNGAFEFVVPPEDSDPAESMILMGTAKAIVISNSTFSWWAATLGGKEIVIAPSKWFRGHEDPVGLIPENWITVQSDWLGRS